MEFRDREEGTQTQSSYKADHSLSSSSDIVNDAPMEQGWSSKSSSMARIPPSDLSLSIPTGKTKQTTISRSRYQNDEPLSLPLHNDPYMHSRSPYEQRLDDSMLMMGVPVSVPYMSVGGLAMPNINHSTLSSPLSALSLTPSSSYLSPDRHNKMSQRKAFGFGSSTAGPTTFGVADHSTFGDRMGSHMALAADTAAANHHKTMHQKHKERHVNPHDHSLLERIYRELHESRFINLMPLALLPNFLNMYFIGMFCHFL